MNQFQKINLFKELLKNIENLRYKDEFKRDEIFRKLEMRIRNIYGSNSSYLKAITRIYFWPGYAPSSEEEKRESWIKGQKETKNLLNTIIEEQELFSSDQKVATENFSEKSNNIFIVHGKDESMKINVARVIEKLKLNPTILHEKPNKGRTIIEKFTDYSDVLYAIVLLSPDDIGYEKESSSIENQYFRARQNVILELGYFLGKLGRERVLVLFREEKKFEIPSDYSGVLFIPFDSAGKWQIDLVKELKASGYDVDANNLL